MATQKMSIAVDRETYACLRMNVRFLSFLEDNGLSSWDKYDRLKAEFEKVWSQEIATKRKGASK